MPVRESLKDQISKYANSISRRPNTKVDVLDHSLRVRLHGNEIVFMDYEKNEIWLSSQTWRSITTFRRINEVLNLLRLDIELRTKRGYWYIENFTKGEQIPFSDGMTIKLS